jgi:hypothetical protein
MSGTILGDTGPGQLQLPLKFGLVVPLYWKVTIGATGAPTLVSADSSPDVTITRTSAGLYAITFPSGGRSKVFSGGSIENDDTSPTAADARIVSDAVINVTAGTGNILTTAGDDGDVADPTSGTTLFYKLEIRVGT